MQTRPPPLTRVAHAALADRLRPGALAVDATAGNGHDTLFLARQVAPSGRVAGFDVQTGALATTHSRLTDAGLVDVVDLYLCGHERMLDTLAADWQGAVAAVTFNLGYLPGSDKGCVTHAASTLPALRQALRLLGRGGMLSVLAYRGHGGGAHEAAAVCDWVGGLDADWEVSVHESPGPVLYLVTRAPRGDVTPG